MKLQQLRYIWEVARHDLNVSATALALYTSQPGVSKQIRLLEDELGMEIFTRSGKHLTKVTPGGKKILEMAGEILNKVEGIKQLSRDHKNPNLGNLSIATTHTQARYALPPVVQSFIAKYPDITLNMIQGTTAQIVDSVVNGDVDFAITTEKLEPQSNLVMMPCYHYGSVILVPKGHPLSQLTDVTIEDIADYPLLTHVFGNDTIENYGLGKAFIQQGLKPNVVFNAGNADVIKTYIRAGLGVGVIADVAYNDHDDSDLAVINTSLVLDSYLTSIVMRKGSFLRSYMYDFIETFAPHLDRRVVDEVMSLSSSEDQEKYFINIDIPTR